MKRRDAISQVAMLVGGAFCLPTLEALARRENIAERGKPLATGFELTQEQRKFLAEVAEHIIPKTSTPGAKEANVPAFIELMLADCYREQEQKNFIAGLNDLATKNFLNLSSSLQVEILRNLETETVELMKSFNVKKEKVGDNVDKESMEGKKQGVPFWRLVKELTLFGYYTSEVGLKASFDYRPIPGKMVNIVLKKGQKSFAY